MRRRGPILALAVALLAPAGAAQGAERSACQKLEGKDLAPAGKVKLVRRKNDEGGNDLRGCVLPRGKVITVASRTGGFTSTSSYRIVQVAGHHVLVDSSSASQYGGHDDTYVVDIKRRRSYTIASFCHEGTDGFCNPDVPNATAERARINSSGQAAAVLSRETSDLVTVEGFSSRGTRKVLDSGTTAEIPPSSLRVAGHVASWTNSGAERSARLPVVTACQKLKAKEDLAPAKRVKLVRRENADNGNDLVGCVLPDGKVSVVATKAKVPGSERKYRILQVAGHEVLIRGELTNQYGHGVSTYVYDLKRATSYNVAESCFDDQGVACNPQTHAVRAFVNAQGQAAAIVRTNGSSTRQVLGFSSTGTSKVLDTGTDAQIPASSLSLDGHVVRWRHSGAPRSATLSG